MEHINPCEDCGGREGGKVVDRGGSGVGVNSPPPLLIAQLLVPEKPSSQPTNQLTTSFA